MVHTARASVNRATARFILRSGSAASKGSSTTPPSTHRSKINHHQLVSVLPAISNRRNLQLESSVTSRKQTTAPNSNRHKFGPNSAPALEAPAVTTHASPITAPKSVTVSSIPLFPNFLIASRQLLDIELTHSQQTRKHFLIASFSAISASAPHRKNPVRIFLTATGPDSEICQPHGSKRETIFLPQHGKPSSDRPARRRRAVATGAAHCESPITTHQSPITTQYRNAACLALLVVLTCPAASGPNWLAWSGMGA